MTNETTDTQAALERAFDAVQYQVERLSGCTNSAMANPSDSYHRNNQQFAERDLVSAMYLLRQAIEQRAKS